MNEVNEEKLLDLLYKKAVTGLDAEELEQLKELEKQFQEVGVRIVFFPYTKGTSSTLLNETLRNERSEIEKAIKYIHDNYKDFQYDIEQFINENELYGIDNLMVHDAKALCEHIKRLKDLKKIGEKSRDGKTKFEMKEGK